MVLDIPFIADLHAMQEHRQQIIDQRLIEANRKRFSYDYQVGDQVYKLIYKPHKLQPRAEGPYTIQSVHHNGTVTIQLDDYVTERLSIRRIRPAT